MVLITTVDDNKSNFLAYDFNRVKSTRSIQCRIRRPKTQDFIKYVARNQIPNCPITVQDIKNAEFIWGPDHGSLSGKTVSQKSHAV